MMTPYATEEQMIRSHIDNHIELVTRTQSQRAKLLDFLKSGYSINLIEAGDLFNIRALSQRIGELRSGKHDGICYDIRDVWEKKIKRYYLHKPMVNL